MPPNLDPGIRGVVTWLREQGYNTTDSGDGRSKADLIAAGHVLPFPHVFMRAEPFHAVRMDERADELAHKLRELGIEPGPQYPDLVVELIYNAFDQVGVLVLRGLDDDGLVRAVAPRKS